MDVGEMKALEVGTRVRYTPEMYWSDTEDPEVQDAVVVAVREEYVALAVGYDAIRSWGDDRVRVSDYRDEGYLYGELTPGNTVESDGAKWRVLECARFAAEQETDAVILSRDLTLPQGSGVFLYSTSAKRLELDPTARS